MEPQLVAQALSDDDLLGRVIALVRQSRVTEAEIVVHIAEVDARRLFAREACSSMFAYCTERLRFSEAEAYLRIAAARASRQHPMLLSMLADGRLHLSAIERLAPHLTLKNRDAVLARAAHKTKRQVEELVAELAPRPDAPALVRRVPSAGSRVVAGRPVLAAAASTAASGGQGAAPRSWSAEDGRDATAPVVGGLRLDGLGAEARPKPVSRAVVEPTAPGRYKVQFTAGAELREKLVRLQALMRRTVPDADLGAVIEQAVSETLERLEAARFAQVKRPRAAAPKAPVPATQTNKPVARRIPAAIRRARRPRTRRRPLPVHGRSGSALLGPARPRVSPSTPVRLRRRAHGRQPLPGVRHPQPDARRGRLRRNRSATPTGNDSSRRPSRKSGPPEP